MEIILYGMELAICRESEWEHGKEKKGGTDLYEGWYVKGMKESIRSV